MKNNTNAATDNHPADETCLADGLVVPADSDVTKLNLNELVIGTTGCGKSWSTAYSRMLHTWNSSIFIPLSKEEIERKFTPLFRKRGYRVLSLNLAHPERSTACYDPLHYVHTHAEVRNLARQIVGELPAYCHEDPYWNEAAANMLAAEIELILLNAKYAGKKAGMADVIRLHKSLRATPTNGGVKTNLDSLFERADTLFPGNQASQLWKSIICCPERMYGSISGIAGSAIDKLAGKETMAIFENSSGQPLDFKAIGEEKTIVFVTVPPACKSVSLLVNILYSNMIHTLFEEAQEKPSGRLDIPVHIVADDFAATGVVEGFAEYISVFRAAGISCTLLLQSESQLVAMYGEANATTILNNCDTYVFMGSMDINTCSHVATRMDKLLSTALELKPGQVAVFRRGMKPFIGRRYPILEDPLYKEAMQLQELSA